jgi:hypothetical protein
MLTEAELEALRELLAIATEIGARLAEHPARTAAEIAGAVGDDASDLSRLARALKAVRAICD